MIIFDETTVAFTQRATQVLHEILGELKLPIIKNKFLYKNAYWPINVVVFEGKVLGTFTSSYLQIGLNRTLIYSVKDSVLKDILRHELAHYLTFIRHGASVESHGAEFRQICKDFGFSKEVAKATMNTSEANDAIEGDIVSERVVEKVKKLLRLASSSNTHEAELATIKANEILLRHNIEIMNESQETIYIDRFCHQSRVSVKLRSIYQILSNFVIRTVISHGSTGCCLEVSGTKTNVLLARYVAEFLERELDNMWEEAKKESGLSGLRSRNSFYAGVARGFNEKMKRSKDAMSEEDQKALTVVDAELKERTAKIYTNLRSSCSKAGMDRKAGAIGLEKGKDLSIRQGLDSNNEKTLAIGER